MASDRVELRVEVPKDEVAVLDGYCIGHGIDRTDVVRRLIREFSEKQLHVATVICRVAGVKPAPSDPDRSP